MIVEVEAKFNTKDNAFTAFNKVNEILNDVENADLVTTKSLHNYIEDYRNSKMKKGLLRFTAFGASVGFIIGALIDIYLTSDFSNINMDSDLGYIFMVSGLITGIMCSILIYFILREKVVPISETDLKNKEAIVVVSIQKRMLPKLRRILFNNGAKSITTV